MVCDVLYNISLRDHSRKNQVVHFYWLKSHVSLPSNLQERQQEPSETILPDRPDIPDNPTIDGTGKGPILPAVPGVQVETDDYSDDDGPELPELPAVPGILDETGTYQDRADCT